MAMPISRKRDSGRQLQADRAKASLSGDGKYMFKNRTGGDLILPKPALSGEKTIRKDAEFLGDSYFFKMVPRELFFMKEVEQPMPKEQVLLTEQPPVVTAAGQVEVVITSADAEPLNETKEKKKDGKKQKLLVEPANEAARVTRTAG